MANIADLMDWLNATYIRVFTWRRGVKVGTDSFGNVYYRERKPRKGMRARRWVVYNGEIEASRVPPEWHGWLHYTQDEPLPPNSPFHKPWVKEHLPNPTGSMNAYRPPGHVLKGGQRARATGDYEAWTPE